VDVNTAYPAQAQPTHATAYQNAVLKDAMAAHPGGVRVSASEVKWPDGSFVIAAPSASSAEPDAYACVSGYFCGWTGTNYDSGNEAAVLASGWYPFGECSPTRYAGCDSGVHSWKNMKNVRVWLEQFQNSGNELCISPGNDNSNYNGVDSSDYWWLISSNTAAC
jgi:hypothetical protein